MGRNRLLVVTIALLMVVSLLNCKKQKPVTSSNTGNSGGAAAPGPKDVSGTKPEKDVAESKATPDADEEETKDVPWERTLYDGGPNGDTTRIEYQNQPGVGPDAHLTKQTSSPDGGGPAGRFGAKYKLDRCQYKPSSVAMDAEALCKKARTCKDAPACEDRLALEALLLNDKALSQHVSCMESTSCASLEKGGSGGLLGHCFRATQKAMPEVHKNVCGALVGKATTCGLSSVDSFASWCSSHISLVRKEVVDGYAACARGACDTLSACVTRVGCQIKSIR
ncbi:MAG: hypothetical protein CMH54_02565 [Myxococcales bacterium]|nr:hypothetical protein [Myxococcales bacterium]